MRSGKKAPAEAEAFSGHGLLFNAHGPADGGVDLVDIVAVLGDAAGLGGHALGTGGIVQEPLHGGRWHPHP